MTVKIRGLKEIQAGLESLPAKMQQNVLASGNGAVARALAKSMKQTAKQTTVKSALVARPNPEKRKSKGYLVGLRKPFSALAHLIEFGTRERVQKNGRRTGKMPASPFMRPAVEQMGSDQVEKIWTKAASRNLDRQLKKLAK